MQYHTKESYEVKEKMHSLYEKARRLDDEAAEYIELQDKMFEMSDSLEIPKGISEVESYGNE